MKNLFMIFTFFSSLYMLQAQSYSISGYIRNSSSGETLLGAILYDKQSGKGVVSNEYEFFSIKLTQGTHVLVISYLGYEEAIQEVYVVENKKINIDLNLDSNSLEEVIIKANKNTKSQTGNVIAGSINLKPQDIKKYLLCLENQTLLEQF